MVNAQLGMSYELSQTLQRLQQQLTALSTQPILLNASTGQGGGVPGITIDTAGVHAFDSTGKNIVGMLTADGSITAFDGTGNPVARFGPLTNSNPGQYGIEVKFNGAWVQVGAGNVDWANITNKPGTYTPSPHAGTHGSGGTDPISIAGSQVTSSVPQADGSQQAYANPVPGTSYYAVYVGNSAGYKFGTNTSSVRGKRNIRRHRINPDNILALKPVVYTRPNNGDYTEYGLIAEQAVETLPEIVQWMDGKIHGIRYDLLSVALLELTQHQQREIDHQKRTNDAILAALKKAGIPVDPPGTAAKHPQHHPPETKANNAPPHPEQPLPYTITED